ncbi:MAG: hypothetical protein AAF619_13735 [Pseudomonadota bacterium]
MPAGIAPFRYSGAPYFERGECRGYLFFHEQTGIFLDGGVGIDTSHFKDQWTGVKPAVEIVTAEFYTARESRSSGQYELFEAA